MDIFNVLTMIGGLCLFLFGMNLMGDALERRAGSSLRVLLGKLTTNRMLGFQPIIILIEEDTKMSKTFQKKRRASRKPNSAGACESRTYAGGGGGVLSV